MPRYIHTFRVEGTGDFPLDMLRYDQCWPRSQDDVYAMHPNYTERKAGEDQVRYIHTFKVERIDTTTGRKVTLLSWNTPTPKRWESFGWRIIEHEKEKHNG